MNNRPARCCFQHGSRQYFRCVMASMLSAVAFLASIWFYQRKSRNGELMFVDYHDDVFQLLLSICGLFFGLAFGLPTKLLPLPTLILLSLGIYVTTTMVCAGLSLYAFYPCPLINIECVFLQSHVCVCMILIIVTHCNPLLPPAIKWNSSATSR